MSQPPQRPGQSDRELAAALSLLNQLRPALEQRNRAKQNDVVSRLVEMRATLGNQWAAIANVVLQNGEITLAKRAMDLFVEHHNGAPSALYRKASLLEQAGALGEAYELLRGLPVNAFDEAAHSYSLGTASLFMGRLEEARIHLERAVTLQPGSGRAWLSLAMASDFSREEALGDRVISAKKQIDPGDTEQLAPYYYALGKVHAERGDHTSAFNAFAHGAGIMKAASNFDRLADKRNADAALEGWTAERLTAIARRQIEATGRTIFVTGTPRSGTTLVEQVLTSHSAVGSGGEIDRLVLLARELRGHGAPAIERFVEERGASEAAQLWDHWLDERCPQPGRVVDKTLNTTRFLGIAAALLPEAPLVWITRDPLDRAWSCFRTFFPVGMQWSYDLEDIAYFFQLEDRLLQHWQALLGDRLLVIPYEEMVSDPAPWIRRLLAHCGLDEEPQVFTPHTTERTVTTASVMQVRQPINRKAVGTAEPYREFMEPFSRSYAG